MRELAYERRFRQWAERRGMTWERSLLPRPEAGGEALAYRISPARPPRATVVTVHGAGNDALFSLVGLHKRLLLRGYRVFAFDLDGHGRHSTTGFAPDRVGGAIAAALERCAAGEERLPVHALGISLGGSVLLHALPELAARITSAVLLAAPLRVHLSWASVRGELGLPLLRTLWRERRHGGIWAAVPAFGPVKRGLYPLRLGVPAPPGAFGYVEVLNAALEALRLEDAARRTRTPVLLCYGERDRLVPIRQGERLAELLPRAELLRLPGHSHLSAPLAPEAVRRVLQWMDEAERAEGSR